MLSCTIVLHLAPEEVNHILTFGYGAVTSLAPYIAALQQKSTLTSVLPRLVTITSLVSQICVADVSLSLSLSL